MKGYKVLQLSSLLCHLTCTGCCHVQNWGKELRHWLGDRVTPVVVDDTRADCVKKSFQVSNQTM